MEATSLEATSQATLELLEARLRRAEHLLLGIEPDADTPPAVKPAVDGLADLERRFSSLVSNVRVYAELLKICMCILSLSLSLSLSPLASHSMQTRRHAETD